LSINIDKKATIDADHGDGTLVIDPQWYAFAMHASLREGLRLYTLAKTTFDGVYVEVAWTDTPGAAKAHTMARHSQDFLRGAIQLSDLLRNSQFLEESESYAVITKALVTLADAKSLMKEIDIWVEYNADISEYAAMCNVQHKAMMASLQVK
jgi:hypothetical protein